MGGYLLDITALIEVMRTAPSRPFLRKLSLVPSADRWTSAPVIGEMLFAARRSAEAGVMKEMLSLIAAIRVAPFDTAAAVTYGRLSASVDWSGAAVSANDIMTVSIAKTLEMTLVTRRPELFARVPQLRIEDWTTD